MVRYLVIDDLRIFKNDYFKGVKKQFIEIRYARNSEEGLDALKDEDGWDIVFLDHDLGGEDTIKPCLDYILEFPHRFDDTNVIVHTSNAYEKGSMHKQLDVAGVHSLTTDASKIFDIDYSLL